MNPHSLHLIEFVNMWRWQLVVYTFVIFVSIPLIALAIHLWRHWDFAKTCASLQVFIAVASACLLLIMAFSQTDVIPDTVHTFDQPHRTAYAAPINYQPSDDQPIHRPAHRAKHKDKCDKDGAIGRFICQNS